jgi:Protein of unknown function (DUF4229)
VSTAAPEPDDAVDEAAPDVAAAQEPQPWAFARYNLARGAILLVALGVFYLAGFRGLALLVVALLVSGAVSFAVLYRLRDAAGRNITRSYRRWSDRIDARAGAEDDDEDDSPDADTRPAAPTDPGA